MFTTDLIHRPTVDWPQRPASKRPAPVPTCEQLRAPTRSAIFGARQALLGQQRDDGSWLAAQRGDGALAGPLVLLLAYLNEEESDLAEQAAHAIRADQRPDGAWSATPDGPADVSASVAAYFALKLVGDQPIESHMRRARHAIRQLGGADASDASTRRWLALLGQIDHDHCSVVAPEWLLLSDRWHRRVFGAPWSGPERRRQTALAVIWALRPSRTIDFARGVRELFVASPHDWPAPDAGAARLLRRWNALARGLERAGVLPWRSHALTLAESLLVRDALDAEVCEADFDELLWQIVALRSLGYDSRSLPLAACEQRMERLLVIDDLDAARPRRSTRGVADSVRALAALATGGVAPSQPQWIRAASWLEKRLLGKATSAQGESPRELASLAADLVELTREPGPSGALPPDMKLSGDRLTRLMTRHRQRSVPLPLLRRILASTCDTLLACLPTLDAADELGPALEALGRYGLPSPQYVVDGAAIRLRLAQHADGSWTGIHDAPVTSTASAIRGLIAVGAVADDPAVAAGVHWLCLEQLENGAWGDLRQTAEVVTTLVIADAADHEACRRGVQFLVDGLTQHSRAGFDEDMSEMAAILSALARWVIATDAIEESPISFRLVGCEAMPSPAPCR